MPILPVIELEFVDAFVFLVVVDFYRTYIKVMLEKGLLVMHVGNADVGWGSAPVV